MDGRRFLLDFDGRTPLVMNSNSGLLDGGIDKGRDKAQWEREHYLDSIYKNAGGQLFIPSRAVKKALILSCRFIADKPRGTSFKSFGPLIEAAMIVEDDAILNVSVEKVVPWTVVVNLDPSKGPKGPRGARTRPLIPLPWKAATTIRAFDALITQEILSKITEAAGWKVGFLDARAIDMGRCDITVKAA